MSGPRLSAAPRLLHHADARSRRMRPTSSSSTTTCCARTRRCAKAATARSSRSATLAIVDEAHQLEDVVTQYFGVSVSTFRIEEFVRDAERALAAAPDEHDRDQFAFDRARPRNRSPTSATPPGGCSISRAASCGSGPARVNGSSSRPRWRSASTMRASRSAAPSTGSEPRSASAQEIPEELQAIAGPRHGDPAGPGDAARRRRSEIRALHRGPRTRRLPARGADRRRRHRPRDGPRRPDRDRADVGDARRRVVVRLRARPARRRRGADAPAAVGIRFPHAERAVPAAGHARSAIARLQSRGRRRHR